MANLTADRKTIRKDGTLFSYPVASGATIYAGALVNLNSTGYAVPAADDATHHFAGKADTRGDNASGQDGDVNVDGHRYGVFEFNTSNMTRADTGVDMYIVDDNTVGKGIVAQPVNATGIALTRISTSRGGSYALAFTATGTTLAYGGGSAVNIGAGGTFTLTASDGSQIMATVTAGSLPVVDKSDTIQLRHVYCGKISEATSTGSVFVDISGAVKG